MRLKLRYISLLSALFCFTFAWADQHPNVFKHITSEQGLPDNQTEGVFILPDGRIGVLSPDLLTIYDGYNFTKYPYNRSTAYYWSEGNLPLANYLDQRNRLWIKGSKALHVFDLKQERFIENVDSLLRSMGVENRLSNLFIGDGQRIWMVDEQGNLLEHDYDDTKLVQIPADDHAHHRIIGMGSSGDRDWLVTDHGEAFNWDYNNREFRRRDTGLEGKIMKEDRVVIAPAAENDFWIMWDRGVAHYDFMQLKWTEPEGMKLPQGDVFTSLKTDAQGNAWIGTGKSSLYYIDIRNKKVTHYNPVHMIDGKSVQNDITNIAIDPISGDVWVGFMFRGLAYGHQNVNVFHGHNNGAKMVRSMVMRPDGNVWLGSLNGLYLYDPTDGKSQIVNGLSNASIRSMAQSADGTLWVGTISDGIYQVKADGSVANHFYSPDVEYHVFNSGIDPNSVLALYVDNQGEVWASMRGGLCKLQKDTGKLTPLSDTFPELAKYTNCNAITSLPDGTMVIGSTTGAFGFDPTKGVLWESVLIAPDANSDVYNHIKVDSRGLVWLGSQNGLVVYDPVKKDTYLIDERNGLSNSVIKAISEDRSRNIWTSTSHGLNRIEVTHNGDKYNFAIRAYTESDGLISGEYYAGSTCTAGDGTIYFGNIDGFTTFSPEDFAFNLVENQPIITTLMIGGNVVEPGEKVGGRIILDKGMASTDEITLNYDQNYVTLMFSGLNFANHEKTFYRYRLKGLDDEWTESTFRDLPGKVSYSNLAPGTYVFQLYTANSDNIWNVTPTELKIVIRPPFWATVWAKICYVLLALGFLYMIFLYLQRRNRQKIEQMRQADAARQKEELDQMKFQFFTNISHEFRTPLTLIITPLQSFMRKMEDGPDKERINSIYRNATHLLGLVNQLLDFRKVEMKGSSLKLKNSNIRDAVATTVDSFREAADEKHISLTFDAQGLSNPYMAFDPGKVYKILNNLLSNALKYTPEGGKVEVLLSSDTMPNDTVPNDTMPNDTFSKETSPNDTPAISLSVEDTGMGIPAKDLPHVFERFFQASNNNTEGKGSSGIGLHLIKELTTLHHGTISVKSVEGKGTCFTVLLPANLHIESESTIEEPAPESQESAEKPQDEKPLVLVVEDNDEFRQYMCSELAEHYRVIEAPDGEKGERMAIENNPSLIISDVMMPIMDGIEMCRHIKENVQTSHIPVVLLTAKASDESRTEGYDAGADAYLTKPFDIDALFARMRRLIEQKQQRQETFRKEITVEPSSITITSVDERLVQKALECVEKNMDNSEYSVDELCSDLAMTRATLYRKMQGITGQTPKDFIRTIRIKRAAQLLRDGKLSVSEIGYMAGFSSPRIFSKNFKEVMGMLPSQYAESQS